MVIGRTMVKSLQSIMKRTYRKIRKQHTKQNKTRRRNNRGGSTSNTSNASNAEQMKLKCSPKPHNEFNSHSCYSNSTLRLLKDKWNSATADKTNKIADTFSPDKVHEFLTNKLGKAEHTWLQHGSSFSLTAAERKKLTEVSFRPEAPKEWITNPTEWLSNDDITKVMKQYERSYDNFVFIGPSPIDFDSKVRGQYVWPALATFSLSSYVTRGKTKIGISFNTDTHDKSGQHWISMFIDITKRLIFFFDSTGDAAPPEIVRFMTRVKQQGEAMQPPIVFTIDSSEGTVHQKGTTECGMYSLYFIVHMLREKTSKQYLKTHRLKDSYIQRFRTFYFNPANSL